MAMNDDDKKFIENAIDKAVDSKLDKFQKQTKTEMKQMELNSQKREKAAQAKLLAELQERDKKGQNTLAQKMEMLSLMTKQAIPDDVQQGFQAGAKTFKSGANQAMSGISHLNARLMMSNPLTAMLYQNRDILQAVGGIGMGTLKMGWGVTKGIGLGAAGLVNAAINKAKEQTAQKEEEQKEKEDKDKKQKQLPDGLPPFEDSSANKLLEEKENLPSKTDENKDPLLKQQKSSNNVLSKGLQGIRDNMKEMGEHFKNMDLKTKLILAGVLLSAVSIVGLAAWFQNGGFQKLIHQLLPGGDESKLKNTFGTNSKYSGLSGQEFKKTFTDQATLGQLTGIAKTDTNTVEKKGLFGKKYKETTGYTYKTGKLTPVPAPFEGIVQHLRLQTTGSKDNQQYKYQIVLARVLPRKNPAASGPMGAAFYPGGAMGQAYSNTPQIDKEITFNGIIDPQVYQGQQVPKDYIIGFSDGSFSVDTKSDKDMNNIMKDYANQVNAGKQENFATAIDTTSKNKDETKTKQTILKGVQKKLKEENKDVKDMNLAEKAVYDLGDFNDIHGKQLDETWKQFTGQDSGTTEDELKVTSNVATPAEGGENQQKANEQNNTLNQKIEEVKEAIKPPETASAQRSANLDNVFAHVSGMSNNRLDSTSLSTPEYYASNANSVNLNTP